MHVATQLGVEYGSSFIDRSLDRNFVCNVDLNVAALRGRNGRRERIAIGDRTNIKDLLGDSACLLVICLLVMCPLVGRVKKYEERVSTLAGQSQELFTIRARNTELITYYHIAACADELFDNLGADAPGTASDDPSVITICMMVCGGC